MSDLPPEIARIFAELERGAPASPLAARAHLERRILEYNRAPQEVLGGLSPNQFADLARGDWTRMGPLRIAAGLTLAEVSESVLFHNARLVLQVIGELGLAKATPSGLLARSVVATVFERMRWVDPEQRDTVLAVCKVINEYDAHLSGIRYLLHQLGLIRKRKGFLLSAEGRRLLAEEQAGELYRRLFISGFRELSMRDEAPEQPAVVRDLAFVLYQLSRQAGDWVAPSRLEGMIWTSDWAGDRVLNSEQAEARRFFTDYRVIWPLVEFGLLEVRYAGEERRVFQRPDVRKTPLFDRVVAFEWGRLDG